MALCQPVFNNQHSNMTPQMRKGPKDADRPRVDLPENRHHWASNDEVEKPNVVLRGPNYLVDDTSAKNTKSKKKYLPTVAAYALTGVALITLAMYISAELAPILK